MLKLPNFLIIGAMKSGTTLLYDALFQHSEIFMPVIKEVHFFSLWNNSGFIPLENAKYRIKNLDKYLDLFKSNKSQKIAGEASTSYLYSISASTNIKNFNSEMKIICVLRNPVDRAYSHYLWHLRNGIEKEEVFCKALLLENERYQNKLDWGYYFKLGLYYDQLKNFYQLFPKDRIKVILYEDFLQYKINTVRQVYDFLEVNSSFLPNLEVKRNPSGIPRYKWLNYLILKTNPALKSFLKNQISRDFYLHLTKIRDKNLIKPELSQKTLVFLKRKYYEDIVKLQDLINIDLRNWYE